MAKSVEDTAYYVYNRLVALNEVGGDPAAFGGSVAEFHAANARRRETTPHSLLATSTHDTKFGEDARARLYVLSEIAGQWADWVMEWRDLNQRHKTRFEGRLAPDANEEYRIYQALLGCWPSNGGAPDEAFRQRLRDHVRKAVNEAKVNTHWFHPNEAWLDACDRFVNAILTPSTGGEFLSSFEPKAQRLAHLGLVNTLAQVVLKITSPGVPDFYQGCEGWNLALVDPDNRALIDWSGKPEALAAIRGVPWRALLRNWKDGGVKVRLTHDLLRFRREHLALFQSGDYQPLMGEGRYADRLVIFARSVPGESLCVVVPRLTATLGCPPIGLTWEDTSVSIPEARNEWRDVLTGREWGSGSTALADLFSDLPLAVLAA